MALLSSSAVVGVSEEERPKEVILACERIVSHATVFASYQAKLKLMQDARRRSVDAATAAATRQIA